MKKYVFASFIVAAALSSVPVLALSTASTEKLVISVNKALVDAVLKQDRDTLKALIADDLLYVHGDGQLRGKKPFIEELGKHLTYKGITLRDESVRVSGNMAVLTAKASFHVFEHGGDAKTEAHITRVFVKNGGQWLLTLHQATRLPVPKPAKKDSGK